MWPAFATAFASYGASVFAGAGERPAFASYGAAAFAGAKTGSGCFSFWLPVDACRFLFPREPTLAACFVRLDFFAFVILRRRRLIARACR